MKEPLPDVVVAASRLRAAVEDTAAALAGADLPRLLASETLLQKVLGELPPAPGSLTPADRARLRHEVEEAQAALRRCRAHGGILIDFVRLSLGAQSQALGYEPAREAAAALTGRTLNERV